MIQIKTKLPVGDNSGAKTIECIKVYKRNHAKSGQKFLASVKKVLPRKKLRKGHIVTGVLIHSKKEKTRKDGSFLRFFKNTGVLIASKKKLPVANRFKGPVCEELHFYGFTKIIKMAKIIL